MPDIEAPYRNDFEGLDEALRTPTICRTPPEAMRPRLLDLPRLIWTWLRSRR